MNNSKELLQSPFFQSVAGLAFESVMVTDVTDDHKNSVIIYVNQAFTDLGSRNSGCFAQNEEEH